MENIKKSFDWHYTKWGGIIAVKLFWLWSKIFRSTEYVVDINMKQGDDRPIIFASNHINRLDPPAIFSAVNISKLNYLAPVKFMTAASYYNSIFKLPLYTTGCYPHKGDGLTGVRGGVYYANHGYNVFVFPEGKRNADYKLGYNYEGIAKLLNQLPNARLVLVNIYWKDRDNIFSRPKLRIIMKASPRAESYTNPDDIMRDVYNLSKTINNTNVK